MTSAELRRALDLIDKIYAAGLDATLWPTFLEELADSIGGVVPGLAVGGSRVEPIALDLPDSAVADYAEHYGPRIQEATFRRPKLGAFVTSTWDDPEIHRYLFDWARPNGLEDAVQGHAVVDGLLVGFGVYRELGDAPFRPSDVELIDVLLPHVGRAVSLANRLDELVLHRDLAEAALERLAVGLVVLGEGGRILAVNTPARRLLEERDGLAVHRERLRAWDRAANRRLHRLVRGTVETGAGRGIAAGGALRVPRPSGERPFELHVTPVPAERFRVGGRQGLAAVFVAAPGQPAVPAESVLSILYELTPAEAHLAVQIARGQSLDEIAHAANLSLHTVRNQLKAVFAKTDTGRQAELVALLQSGVARLG